MIKTIILLLACFMMSILQAQVTISTDFTNENFKKEPLHNIWTVANRISPTNGSNVRPDLKVNLVRMIGGIKKTVNGQNVPNLDFDPCRFDSLTDTYIYNWTPLINRLNKIVNSDVKIHQIVLDQPPWAFQHGYTFIPEGTSDSIHFREDERITTYGNSLPPADKEAYHDFIKALMIKLVETYGEELVRSWRFRVGSEIETPDHWKGSEQDFIEHFANTERAVREVLPNAKVGIHTRPPDFVYKNGTVLNYKGEPIKSFSKNLIEFCSNNNVRYDFWGISDYILINREDFRQMSEKYNELFVDLVNHPKWNKDATLDLMEYSTVTTMNGDDGKGYITCQTSHTDVAELAFANQFYRNSDKGLEFIYRWGNRPNSTDPINIEVLNTMNGMIRYETEVAGKPGVTGNDLDAIFGKSEGSNEFDALIYNFNANSLDYAKEEEVTISFATELPVGSVFYFRSISYGKENNELQTFLENEPASGWIKSGFDSKGDPSRTLNDAGIAAYNSFSNPNPSKFGGWKSIESKARTDGKAGSVITLSTEILSFAFQKFEIRPKENFVKPISPTKVIWTSTEDFSPWKAVTNGMFVETKDDKLTLNFSEGFEFPMAAITGLNIKAELFDTLRLVVKNSTEDNSIQMAANVPGTEFSPSRKKVTISNDNETHSILIDISNWNLWTGIITEFKLYNSVNSGRIEIDTMEFIPSEMAIFRNIILEKEGAGILNYESGTCFDGQEFTLNAIAEEGWGFAGWTGDITSTENPIKITVNSDMSIKAIFKEKIQLNVSAENGTVLKTPDVDDYLLGQSVELIAKPNFGYRFTDWSGDIESLTDTITIVMDSTINLRANFEALPTYTLNITAENGYVDRTPYAGSYEQGTSVELSVREKYGYRFSGWTGDVESSEKTITVIMDSTINLKANFELIIYYNLTVISEHGYVIKIPTKNRYEKGEIVTLSTVVADDGYEFSGWLGDTTGIEIPLVLAMDSNITITASFRLATAISEMQNNLISVYPNPSGDGIFTISEPQNWSLFTTTGEFILNGKSNKFDISAYPRGTYILKTDSENITVIYQ